MSLSRTAAGVVGPAVGGTLIALISPGVAVAGDAATFLVSAGSLALLRLEWPAREAMGASMLTEFREGLAEVRKRTWIWVLIVYFGWRVIRRGRERRTAVAPAAAAGA